MAPMTSSSTYDKYLGRKEICLLTESTVQRIFPINTSSIASSSKNSAVPNLGEWLAYFFYRTALPDQTILHALHLLRRITATFIFDPSVSSSPLVHHRLIFTALVLATKYHMDDSYSNKSFSIASKGMFTVKEVNEMEFDMLESLDWMIGEEGTGSIVEIIERYEIEFKEWSEKLKEYESLKEKKRTGRHHSRTSSKLSFLKFIDPNSSSSSTESISYLPGSQVSAY